MQRKRALKIYFTIVSVFVLFSILLLIQLKTPDKNEEVTLDSLIDSEEIVANESSKDSEETEGNEEGSIEETHDANLSDQELVQVTSQGFIATFFTFNEQNLKNASNYLTGSAKEKLAKESNQPSSEVSDVKLLSLKVIDGKYQIQHQLTRKVSDSGKERIITCLLTLTKNNDGQWLISDYEWSELSLE